MLRGGSWNNNQQNARAAYRNNNRPDNLNNNYGFRLLVVGDDSEHLDGKSARCCLAVIGGRGQTMLNQRGLFPAEVR